MPIRAGSKITLASPVIKFTAASTTPGLRVSARWTLAWHAAQVMPPTSSVAVSVGDEAVASVETGIKIPYPISA
jgi:hypothetical protein